MLTLSGSAYPFHDSILQPCPGHKRKNGLPLDFTPELNEFWTAHPRETFGSRTDAFSTQFTGFSICHPMYDNKHMLKVGQHATASALINQEATATFLLLPNWMENSITSFNKPAPTTRMFAQIFGNVPDRVRYMPLLYQQSKTPPLPEATWKVRTLVVWSKAAREQLITNNLPWLEKIKQDLSLAAIWNFKNAGTIPFCKAPTESILPRMTEICRLPKDLRKTVTNANIGDISDTKHSQVPSHHIQQKRLLEFKAPNWKEWDFTDGSYITNKENGSQFIGVGVYHSQSNKTTTVNPGGTSVQNYKLSRASEDRCCFDK
jgi:hypothetical protein